MQTSDWLTRGDAPEADWAPHVLRLATRGGLGRVGDLLLDLPSLAQPWSCQSGACTPGLRETRHRSCCADLDVGIAPEEEEAIDASILSIAAQMTGDPRWTGPVPRWRDAGVLTRPGRRCIFARLEPTGLQCGLHRTEDAAGLPRGALKPLPCRLFPLALIDLGDRRLLTAVHRSTARFLASGSARRFPCVGVGTRALARAEWKTLAELFGARAGERIARAAEDWAMANQSAAE